VAQYIVLINWTEQGVSQVKDTVKRSEQVRQLAEQMGGAMSTIYWTIGRYDVVAIIEAPDDETAAAIGLRASGTGAVRTETLRAFTADEMSGILAKLG
jgi:uncharacterized protein with GYD domain